MDLEQKAAMQIMKYTVVMGIKGGKLADGLEYNISVEFDFTGLSIDNLHSMLIDSSSPRVKLANKFRNMKPAELDKLKTNGYKCLVKDLGTRGNVTLAPADALMVMDKAKFIATLESTWDMEPGEAERIYNRKHKITM
jgi:hypothetical protein